MTALAPCPPLQLFDVRMGARMLSSVPFAPGPALLRFHPRFSSTLLLASASGAFTLADAQGMSGGPAWNSCFAPCAGGVVDYGQPYVTSSLMLPLLSGLRWLAGSLWA